MYYTSKPKFNHGIILVAGFGVIIIILVNLLNKVDAFLMTDNTQNSQEVVSKEIDNENNINNIIQNLNYSVVRHIEIVINWNNSFFTKC